MKAVKLKCKFFLISADKCKLLINNTVTHCTKLVGVISCRLEYVYNELYCSELSFCLNM